LKGDLGGSPRIYNSLETASKGGAKGTATDGQTIAFAGEDNTVKLWSLDGRELQTFGGHRARVKSLSFSPNGRILASASDDGTVRLWKLDRSKWNLSLEDLLVRGCNWLRDYLKTNPNVSQCDRTLCDGIGSHN
jgi:WD40 repeat protein